MAAYRARKCLDIEGNFSEDMFIDGILDDLDSQETLSCNICGRIIENYKGFGTL